MRDSDRAYGKTGDDIGTEYRTGPDGYRHEYDKATGADLGMTWQERQRYERDQRRAQEDSNKNAFYTEDSASYQNSSTYENTHESYRNPGFYSGSASSGDGISILGLIILVPILLIIVFTVGRFLILPWIQYPGWIASGFQSFGIWTGLMRVISFILLIVVTGVSLIQSYSRNGIVTAALYLIGLAVIFGLLNLLTGKTADFLFLMRSGIIPAVLMIIIGLKHAN